MAASFRKRSNLLPVLDDHGDYRDAAVSEWQDPHNRQAPPPRYPGGVHVEMRDHATIRQQPRGGPVMAASPVPIPTPRGVQRPPISPYGSDGTLFSLSSSSSNGGSITGTVAALSRKSVRATNGDAMADIVRSVGGSTLEWIGRTFLRQPTALNLHTLPFWQRLVEQFDRGYQWPTHPCSPDSGRMCIYTVMSVNCEQCDVSFVVPTRSLAAAVVIRYLTYLLETGEMDMMMAPQQLFAIPQVMLDPTATVIASEMNRSYLIRKSSLLS